MYSSRGADVYHYNNGQSEQPMLNGGVTQDTINSTTINNFPVNQAPTTTPGFNSVLPSGINLTGIYSSSGFDLITLLSHVVNRPNKVINIGPIDTSCSFLVTDPRLFDNPIVYVSETFEKLTGYTQGEILGKNCRFLQSPNGRIVKGTKRLYTDNEVVAQMKMTVDKLQECQFTLINYKKGGEPFINLVTLIPISLDQKTISYIVGLQIDLVAQPQTILNRVKDGSYLVNYQLSKVVTPAQHREAELTAFSEDIRNMFDILDDPSCSSSMPSPSMPSSSSGGDHSEPPSPAFLGTMQANIPATIIMPEAATFLSSAIPFPLQPATTIINPKFVTAKSTSSMTRKSSSSRRQSLEKHPAPAYNFFSSTALIENAADTVFILSIRGIILYVAPECRKHFEYGSEEMVSRSISDFIHPSDVVYVLRGLRNSISPESMSADSTSNSLNVCCRFKRKHSGYIFVELRGKVYSGVNSKRTRCLIMTTREFCFGKLSSKDIMVPNNAIDDCWLKLSPRGLVLHADTATETVLGIPHSSLVTSSFVEHLHPCDVGRLVELFEMIRNHGQLAGPRDITVRLKPHYGDSVYLLRLYVNVDSVLQRQESQITTSGSSSSDFNNIDEALAFLKPTMEEDCKSSSEIMDIKPRGIRFLLAQIRDIGTMSHLVSSLPPVNHEVTENNGGVYIAAPPTPSSPPLVYTAPLLPKHNEHDLFGPTEVFEILNPVRATSLAYETNQLRLNNKRLREECDRLLMEEGHKHPRIADRTFA